MYKSFFFFILVCVPALAGERTLQRVEVEAFLKRYTPNEYLDVSDAHIKPTQIYDVVSTLRVLTHSTFTSEWTAVPIFLTEITRALTSLIEQTGNYSFLAEAQDLNEAMTSPIYSLPLPSQGKLSNSFFKIVFYIGAATFTAQEAQKIQKVFELHADDMFVSLQHITHACQLHLSFTPNFVGGGNFLVFRSLERNFKILSSSHETFRQAFSDFFLN